MRDVVIVSAVRSAICKSGSGRLANTRPDVLLAEVMKEALGRLPQMNWQEIEEVVIGCSNQEGELGLNVARTASLMAGVPSSVSALTINRFGAASLSAVSYAEMCISRGRGDIMIAGGVESLSRIPIGGYNPSPPPSLLRTKPESLTPPGVAAENLARKYRITREQQDLFAHESQTKAMNAIQNGYFMQEIVPVNALTEDGEKIRLQLDECPKDSDLEKLGKLKPVFTQNGTVTAGNSASFADAAAVMIVMSAKKAEQLGLEPFAMVRASRRAATGAEILMISAAEAAKKALADAEMKMEDMDIIALPEQQAASAIAVARELDIEGEERINPNGGAIAFGDPVSATGGIMLISLLHELRRGRKNKGLVTIGAIGGLGEAMIVERV